MYAHIDTQNLVADTIFIYGLAQKLRTLFNINIYICR